MFDIDTIKQINAETEREEKEGAFDNGGEVIAQVLRAETQKRVEKYGKDWYTQSCARSAFGSTLEEDLIY